MKYVRTRRGLSTVVTGAIMLTFVAVLGTAIVGWSNSNLKAFETSLANSTGTSTNQLNENLIIENIQFCKKACGVPLSNGLNVTVTNDGTVPFTVSQIQLNSTAYTSASNLVTFGGASYTILPKQSTVFGFSKTVTWHDYDATTVSVTTSRGSIVTTQAVAP